MVDIVIKITIPQGEYERWVEFEEGGIENVKKQLRIDFIGANKSLGIYDADLEIYED